MGSVRDRGVGRGEKEIVGDEDPPVEIKSNISAKPGFRSARTSEFGFGNTDIVVGGSGRAFPVIGMNWSGMTERTGGLL
jgi:hypothetical protein